MYLYDLKERSRLVLRDLAYLGMAANRKMLKGRDERLILCNSYPKSGTHMLSQILSSVQGVKYWNDIVSVQSLSGVMNSRSHLKWKLDSVPPGGLVRSHLMYNDDVLEVLERREYKKFFIYRDPRDVVLSHATWVMNEPRIYLNKIYEHCYTTPEERVLASIEGVPIGKLFGNSSSQPNIAQDFSRWAGWIDDPDTFSVKFEDLVGERGGGDEATRLEIVKRIFEFLEIDISEDVIASKFSSTAMNPEKSHTFRKGNKGGIAGWKNKFTEEHKSAFKKVAGQLLIDLGYEKDMNW